VGLGEGDIIMKKITYRKSPIPSRFLSQGEPSDVRLFREKWHKRGFELINITDKLEPKLGNSGWCGDFCDYDEPIYHIQLWYMGQEVASIGPNKFNIIEDDKYVGFTTNEDDFMGADFIVFRKVSR